VRAFVLLLACGLCAGLVAPASAQWIRVGALPTTDVFSVRSLGDTIVAGVDTALFVSTDAGATWRRSAKPVAGVNLIGAVLMHNRRLYAGTFGQGVFVSDDLGTTWQAFNQGLVGGILDSQLDIADFEVRGSDLFVATFGAGVYARSLVGVDTWHPFGDAFEPNQASNVNDLALGGASNTRLFACAGVNGQAFDRDPGARDWTVSTFRNGPLTPGLGVQSALWSGDRWVVGTNQGIFLSPTGEDAWTVASPIVPGVKQSSLALHGHALFIGFDVNTDFSLSQSLDDGSTWSPVETVLNAFVYQLAAQGGELFAARADGLWFRSVATVSVGGDGAGDLRFALAGRQPVHESARFHFDLPRADAVAIEVFDVAGRRTPGRIEGVLPAGGHDVTWDTRGLAAGVYLARLTAAGASQTARFACVH
jgi:photosystem II stability/assembly factor-like uncharacterized protein